MSQLKIAFLPLGRVNFHMESAQECFDKSQDVLLKIHPEILMPKKILTSIEELKDFLASCLQAELLIIQNTTFVDSTFVAEIGRTIDSPLLLWTVREPIIDGGRLRLNSLTGAFSAGNLLYNRGKRFEYIFGAPEDTAVINKITAVIKAIKVKKALQNLTVGVVGNAPSGFYFSNALDTEVQNAVGAKLEYIEAREIIARAKKIDKDEYKEHTSMGNFGGTENIPQENMEGYSRLYGAYTAFVAEKGIKALASRCWPDFFVEYGTPVCGVLSSLTEEGVVSSCEADVYGAISMFILRELTGTAPYFGDPVSLDEQNNTISFWHCGAGASSLAHKTSGPRVGVHPNRKIGPTMEFGLKEGRVTVIRLGRKPDGTFRLFLMTGEALDVPQRFLGTSVEVRVDTSAPQVINSAVVDGWEPHFALVYGDISEEIRVLGRLLDLEVVEY